MLFASFFVPSDLHFAGLPDTDAVCALRLRDSSLTLDSQPRSGSRSHCHADSHQPVVAAPLCKEVSSFC